MKMRSIAVYCGASRGTVDTYLEAARSLGRLMAERRIKLIYGGGSIGLMGAIADSILEHGGEAIGVIPRFLDEHELGHRGLTELIVVETMHERKQRMADLADGLSVDDDAGSLNSLDGGDHAGRLSGPADRDAWCGATRITAWTVDGSARTR